MGSSPLSGDYGVGLPPLGGGGGLPCDFGTCGGPSINPYSTDPVAAPAASPYDYVIQTFVAWPFLPNPANNAMPSTLVIRQGNGRFKPNVPPLWGFCSAYRDGTGAGEALYQICMRTGNNEWSNCVRGMLLNQYTPNPNPFQLVWYLGPDHAYDFATCAVGR